MKKNFSLLILGLLFTIPSWGQNPALEWAVSMEGNAGNGGISITTDHSANVYTAGYFSGTVDFGTGTTTFNLTSLGTRDAFIQKLDSSGNMIWTKAIGGTTYVGPSSTLTDDSGNVFLTGYFQNTVDFDPNSGIYNLTATDTLDAFALKLDSDGNFIWAKSFGGIGVDFSNILDIDVSGNIYLSGVFEKTVDFNPGIGTYNLTANDSLDAFIIKLDNNGSFVWAKSFGGIGVDIGRTMELDALGNVYISGSFSSTVDFDPGVGTYNLTSNGSMDFYVLKLDSNGNFVWVKSFGSLGFDGSISISIDNIGNICLTGLFQNTVDFDPGLGVFNLTSSGINTFILKLNPSGNFIWAKKIDGALYSSLSPYSLDNDKLNNIYLTGYFYDTIDFDPGPGTNQVYAYFDIFIQKLNSSGDFVWVQTFSSSGINMGNCIHLDTSNNIYLTGLFQSTIDFDPSPNVFNLTGNSSGYSTDIFVLKLSQTTNTSINYLSQQNLNINLYPNPITNHLTIESEERLKSIQLIDIKGSIIKNIQTKKQQITINTNDIHSGIYFCKIITESGTVFSKKLIKQ